jgi:hypothetical protein
MFSGPARYDGPGRAGPGNTSAMRVNVTVRIVIIALYAPY